MVLLQPAVLFLAVLLTLKALPKQQLADSHMPRWLDGDCKTTAVALFVAIERNSTSVGRTWQWATSCLQRSGGSWPTPSAARPITGGATMVQAFRIPTIYNLRIEPPGFARLIPARGGSRERERAEIIAPVALEPLLGCSTGSQRREEHFFELKI